MDNNNPENNYFSTSFDYNNIITVIEKSFCCLILDNTPFVVLAKPIKTSDYDREMVLLTISELGEAPMVYDIFDKRFFTPNYKMVIVEFLEKFLTREYRLVHLVDRTNSESAVHINAYKSKRFSNKVCTMFFKIDKDTEEYAADLFKVYDKEDNESYYRFVVYNKENHLKVTDAISIADEDVGVLFKALLEEFIKVVRIARKTSSSFMDIWDSDKWKCFTTKLLALAFMLFVIGC